MRLHEITGPIDDAASRARQLGFDVDELVYHGTRAGEFPSFRLSYRPKEQLGFGIHVTPDETLARRYADDPQVARKGTSPFVFAGFLRKGKVLDADAIVKQGSIEFELAKKLAGQRFFVINDHEGVPCAYMQKCIDSTSPKRAEALIKAAGYNTIRYNAKIISPGTGGYTKHGEAIAYVVLNPAALRRTNAKFNPEQAESDDLSA